MLPRSPPLPFTQRICFVFPSSGSTCSSFELVFPPPKFVIRRSEPSRFDRYLSNSGASSFAAIASSQRSSRNRSPLCAVMCQPLSKSSPDYHSTRNTNTATISNVKKRASDPRGQHRSTATATSPASPSDEPHSYTAPRSAPSAATVPDGSGSAHTNSSRAKPSRSVATCPSSSPELPRRCNPVPQSQRASPASAPALHPPLPIRSSP